MGRDRKYILGGKRTLKMKEMYLEGATLQQIGDEVGITRERARQILTIESGEDFQYTRVKQRSEFEKKFFKALLPTLKDYALTKRISSKRALGEALMPFLRRTHLTSEWKDMEGFDWDAFHKKVRRLEMIDEYKELSLQLGYNPNSYYLQKHHRNLEGQIRRSFGTFTRFINAWEQMGYYKNTKSRTTK